MDDRAIARAVECLAANRARPGPLDGLPEDLRPTDEEEGYAVQSALSAALSKAGMGPVAGAKIGCTTAVMQDYMRIASPCAGTMHRTGLRESPAELRFGEFHHVGVECEIAVRLASAPPASEIPLGLDDVADCVHSCMAAIEIVDDRYRDFRTIDTPTLIADDFFHAGCVLGPAVSDWRDIDLESVSGRMAINGDVVGTGVGADILGHPLNALAWLANSHRARHYDLKAGSIVMLGSVVKTVWVAAGDVVDIEIEGLGKARATFSPLP